jgi:hypothetical protein
MRWRRNADEHVVCNRVPICEREVPRCGVRSSAAHYWRTDRPSTRRPVSSRLSSRLSFHIFPIACTVDMSVDHHDMARHAGVPSASETATGSGLWQARYVDQ